MPRLVVTNLANYDVQEILSYLKQEAPEAVMYVRSELRDGIRRLARQPSLGHTRPDLCRQEVLFWAVFSYLVVYRRTDSGVEILRVLHAARDVERLLKNL